MKKILCVLNILAMINYVIVISIGAYMREPWFTYLFTCVSSLFLCISVIGYKKTWFRKINCVNGINP